MRCRADLSRREACAALLPMSLRGSEEALWGSCAVCLQCLRSLLGAVIAVKGCGLLMMLCCAQMRDDCLA